MNSKWTWRAIVASSLLSAHVVSAQEPLEPLERALVRQAPKLVKTFQQKGYKNVGVLKFLVCHEGQSFTDNVGTLNLLLARRLELALILANDPRAPVGIVENANSVAKSLSGASHLSKAGRARLFEGKYALAWGKEHVRPDAFVTGTAQISSDLRRLTISLLLFDRTENVLGALTEDFQVANQADRLVEMGESFVMRGLFDEGTVEPTSPKNATQEKVMQTAVKIREQAQPHPADLPDAPVSLEVRYDFKKVPIETKGGKAYVPEPREGQNVALVLKRDGSQERYGIVLKVNGENTRDRQTLPDLHCRRWIMDPGEQPYVIDGYQIGDKQMQKFRVLSAVESRQREVNYGSDVGTITMTVFKEAKGPSRPAYPDPEVQKQAVVARLTTLSERPKNYNALKASLLDDANRGLIAEGQKVASNIQLVSFRPDPRPVMCLTVVYYKR